MNLHVWELEVQGRSWIQNQQQKNSTSEAMSQVEASGGRTELSTDCSKETRFRRWWAVCFLVEAFPDSG